MFRQAMHPSPVRRALLLTCLVTSATLLSACGAGGVEDTGAIAYSPPSIGTALRITTTSIPSASSGVYYETTTLQTSGANGTVRWTVAGGALPPGISLAGDGRVSGTPAKSGYYQFTAEARDGNAIDQQSLIISVDTFGITAIEGLQFGDALTGVPVTLQCAGFDHDVTFEIVSNDSGGRFEQVDANAGRAVWIPGPSNAQGSQDILRADCGSTGRSAEVTLDIAPDATVGHVAAFGSTDVWYLDFDGKRGAHPYASDWHASLARLGLRRSTDVLGSEADQLADLLARLSVLGRLNQYFLRQADGSAGPNGLAISFPLERPGAGYGTPVPGSLAPAQSNLFSTMSVGDQSGALSAYGVAITDVVGNPRVENNSTGGAPGELGVFVNQITESLEYAYRQHGADLRLNPIGADDVPALKAILYGRSNPGGRYDITRYYIEALGESVAYIAAHEAGHSLGLGHTAVYTPGSIMNTIGIVSPAVDYFFLEPDLAALRAGLPGGGRITGGQKISAPQMAAVTVCRGDCQHK